LQRQTNLFQIVRALHTSSRFTRRLNGRKEKPDQDTDDRDNDQQFDQGKTMASFLRITHENSL
jgi:hypothetical protein